MRGLLGRIEAALLRDEQTEVRILRGDLRGAKFQLNRATETKLWLGIYEPQVTAAVRRLAQPGSCSWDIGAFAGYFTLLMERRGCRVVAVEPHPGNAARLRRNLAMNHSSATVLELAITDHDGDASLGEAHTGSEHALAASGLPIRTATLDTLTHEHGLPQLVKVDVEGAELSVLAGASSLLLERVPFVMETHSDRLGEQAREIFERHGYRVTRAGDSIVAV